MAAITLTGHIVADAQARRTREGASVLSFDLALPCPGFGDRQRASARVVHLYGTGESAAYAAKARAARLRRGVRVTVSCGGASKGRGPLLLLDIDRIEEPDLAIRNVTGEARDL